MQFVDIQKLWKRLGPIYRSEAAREIWLPELNLMSVIKSQRNGFSARLNFEAKAPSDFDFCDWRYGKPGRKPAYWDFACHGACHWLAPLNIWVAMQTEPNTPWQIVRSEVHSTVWDGKDRLWDLNYLARDIPANEAWQLAAQQGSTEFLPVASMNNADLGEDWYTGDWHRTVESYVASTDDQHPEALGRKERI